MVHCAQGALQTFTLFFGVLASTLSRVRELRGVGLQQEAAMDPDFGGDEESNFGGEFGSESDFGGDGQVTCEPHLTDPASGNSLPQTQLQEFEDQLLHLDDLANQVISEFTTTSERERSALNRARSAEKQLDQALKRIKELERKSKAPVDDDKIPPPPPKDGLKERDEALALLATVKDAPAGGAGRGPQTLTKSCNGSRLRATTRQASSAAASATVAAKRELDGVHQPKSNKRPKRGGPGSKSPVDDDKVPVPQPSDVVTAMVCSPDNGASPASSNSSLVSAEVNDITIHGTTDEVSDNTIHATTETEVAEKEVLEGDEAKTLLSAGKIKLVPDENATASVATGGRRPAGAPRKVHPSGSARRLYVLRGVDGPKKGLNAFPIMEHYQGFFSALDTFIGTLPVERRKTNGTKHWLMTYSGCKLANEDERNAMYKAIWSCKRADRPQNKRRKTALTASKVPGGRWVDFARQLKHRHTQNIQFARQMLNEMAMLHSDEPRQGHLYLDYEFSDKQWNKIGFRLMTGGRAGHVDIQPFTFVKK